MQAPYKAATLVSHLRIRGNNGRQLQVVTPLDYAFRGVVLVAGQHGDEQSSVAFAAAR
jgi:hypothetical protein